jgi:hypothetical protein
MRLKNNFCKILLFLAQKILIIFYKIKNVKKKKILIYTDSRGFNLLNKEWKSSLFNTYAWELVKKYNCTLQICKHKHTTFYDFFDYVEKNKLYKDNLIICHIGVVDFSPRKQTQIKEILKLKNQKILDVFCKDSDALLKPYIYKVKYLDEFTSSLVDLEKVKFISKKLSKYSNLIWINSNPIIENWLGNYWRKRPSNMNEILKIQKKIEVKNTIDISSWNDKMIKKYTIDNIHFNNQGMKYILNQITKKIEDS